MCLHVYCLTRQATTSLHVTVQYTASAPSRPKGSIFHGTTDHVERLLRFCRESGKPCALLMPNYVYMKVRSGFGYLSNGLFRCGGPDAACQKLLSMIILIPNQDYFPESTRGLSLAAIEPSCGRYSYEAPRAEVFRDSHGQVRNKKTKKTAPFVSFWYLLAPAQQSQGTSKGHRPWWSGAPAAHVLQEPR